MLIDVSDVVSDFNVQPIVVLRSPVNASPDYEKGRKVATGAAVTTLYREADVQQATGRDLLNVPENARTLSAISIHSASGEDDFYTDDEKNSRVADIIIWNNRNWKVRFVDNYAANGYWRCIATEVNK